MRCLKSTPAKLAYNRGYQARIRGERIARGVCARCGTKPPLDDMRTCLECKLELRECLSRHLSRIRNSEREV